MKRLKKLACLLLAGAMLFGTACSAGQSSSSSGKEENGAEKAGRYVETDITPEGVVGRFVSYVTPQGAIVCYSEDLKIRYESTDSGENWTQAPGPAEKDSRFEKLDIFSVADDGTIFASFKEAVEQDGEPCWFLKIAPDGSMQALVLPEFEEAVQKGQTPMLHTLKAVSSNRLLVSFGYGGDMYMPGGDEGDADMPQGEPDSESTPAPEGEPDAESAPAPESSPSSEATSQGDSETPETPTPQSDESIKEGEDDDGGGVTMGSGFTRVSGLYDTDTGKMLADFSNSSDMAYATVNEVLYSMDYEGAVKARSLADGKEQTDPGVSFPMSQMQMMMNVPLAASKDGNFYQLDNSAMKRAKSGEETETILDASNYSFGNPTAELLWLAALENGEFLISTLEDGNGHMYRIKFDPAAKTDPEKTLKIWALKDNRIVRAAITEFRKKNPDALIQFEVAQTEQEGEAEVDTADAIKTLNTQLLAGDGPDIMILDGCPLESYIDKGLLADMSELVDGSGIYENLASSFKTDKGTFVLPMRFKIPMLVGSEENLAKVNTLEELLTQITSGNDTPAFNPESSFDALKENERPNFNFENLQEVFDLLWDTGASSVVKDGKIDSDALRTLLKTAKSVSDRFELANRQDEEMGGAMAVTTGAGSDSIITGSAMAFMSQRANYGGFTTGDLMILQFMMDQKNTQFKSLPGLQEGAWVPSVLAGINADSKVEKFAAEFLNTMLSPAVQGTRLSGGFPVTPEGMDSQIEGFNKEMQKFQGETFKLDLNPLISTLKQPVFYDKALADTFYAGTEEFCKGALDLEGTVSKIEQELRNYLAERQ